LRKTKISNPTNTCKGIQMFKKKVVAYVAIFNVLVIALYVFSTVYMWDSLKTMVDTGAGGSYENGFVVPFVEESGLQVTISHVFYGINGNQTVVNLGPLPTPVPNYPFYVFWVAIVGNLVLMALVLRKGSKHI
jgi:hypothetical protein